MMNEMPLSIRSTPLSLFLSFSLLLFLTTSAAVVFVACSSASSGALMTAEALEPFLSFLLGDSFLELEPPMVVR